MKTIIIDKPENIDKKLFPQLIDPQLIDLVYSGGAIKRRISIEKGLPKAKFIALLVDNNVILSSATLKHPRTSYRDKVFTLAGVGDLKRDHLLELGYIVTHPNYQQKGLCRELLTEFFKIIENEPMYATTEYPYMVRIFEEFNFKKFGDKYEDKELFICNY